MLAPFTVLARQEAFSTQIGDKNALHVRRDRPPVFSCGFLRSFFHVIRHPDRYCRSFCHVSQCVQLTFIFDEFMLHSVAHKRNSLHLRNNVSMENDMNATSANDTGLTADAVERLDAFARETGTKPPSVLEDQGVGATFTTEFLAYCQRTGLSLDWFIFGTGRRTWMEDRA